MTSKILGNNKKGHLFIVSAPAGTGKTTLVRLLAKEFSCVVPSISFTSRLPRPREKEGVDYYFLDKENFEAKIAAGDFLEYVRLYDCYYGTSRDWVYKNLSEGKHVVLVIDTQGALQLKGKIPATFIFISPPSLDELRQRLERRQTENSEMVEKRLALAVKELETSKHYDYVVVNDDLHVAYEVLRSIFIAEEHRVNKDP